MTEVHQDAPREAHFLLARPERAVLNWFAERMPARVQPDHLTVVALVAAVGIAAAYLASNRDPAWLWLATAFLAVHWFGDSLDGSLARHRKIERPRYGFYIDHLADAFATAMIGLGLGLSPYMLLSVGLVIVIGYLMLSINVYLETHVFNRFELGYGLIGPTEARLALILLNVLLALGVGLDFTIEGLGMTVLDLIGLAGAGVMGVMLVGRAAKNLRELAIEEPSARQIERMA